MKFNQLLFSRSFWLISLILVIVLLFLTSLSSSVRGGLIQLFLASGMSGAVAAYAISFTRMKNWQAGVMLLISGFSGLVFYIAHLGELLPQLINPLNILRIQIIIWAINQTSLPVFQPVGIILIELFERSMTLITRVWDWLSKVRMGSVINDPVARAFTWSFAVFALSAWAVWVMSRYRNPLVAFAPMIAVLAIVADYTGRGFIPLWLILAGVLILMGIARYDSNRVRWQRNKVDFSESIPIDSGVAVAILTAALAASAWIMPSFSVRAMAETIRNWGKSQDELAESFGLQPAPAPSSLFAPYISPQVLPRSHLVGSGPELSRQFIMTIRTRELLPQPPISNSPPAPRHYWRSLTYDIYTGNRWLSSPVEVNSYKAEQPLYEIHPKGYRLVTQEITLLQDLGGQLYWTGQLVSVNQNYEAAWRTRPDNLSKSDPFAGMDLLGAVSPAKSYTATSLESAITQNDLRSSVGPYPPSITRYLSLPDSVPGRVLSLARDLTASSATPYDRAQAIETYLRTNYPYTLDVPAPPVGRDIADYFLFDLKKGYCDYYATAMVVLARAAGLPARLVIGYASGTYDYPHAQYIISEANAHSWVEVFFTDFGWVEFEPTAGLPAINRRDEPLLQSTDAFPLKQIEKSTNWELINTLLNFLAKLGIATLLFGSITFATLWIESAVLFLQPVPLSLTQIFKRMEKLGNRLIGNKAGETPYEYSVKLKLGMNSIRTQMVTGKSSFTREVDLITDSYVLSTFSQNPIQRKHVFLVIHSWRRLRLRLMLAIFLASIGSRMGSG